MFGLLFNTTCFTALARLLSLPFASFLFCIFTIQNVLMWLIIDSRIHCQIEWRQNCFSHSLSFFFFFLSFFLSFVWK
jgi:hypothetical protein